MSLGQLHAVLHRYLIGAGEHSRNRKPVVVLDASGRAVAIFLSALSYIRLIELPALEWLEESAAPDDGPTFAYKEVRFSVGYVHAREVYVAAPAEQGLIDALTLGNGLGSGALHYRLPEPIRLQVGPE